MRDRRYNKIEERKAEIIEDKKELRDMNINKAASKIQSKFRENEKKKTQEADSSESEKKDETKEVKKRVESQKKIYMKDINLCLLIWHQI